MTPAAQRRRPPLALALLAVAVAVAALLPLAYLLVRSSDAGVAKAVDVAVSHRTSGLLWRSVLLAALVTTTSVAVAVPLAWLTARTDVPGRRFWTVATALPLVVPSYIAAYAVLSAFGPGGLVAPGLPRLDGLAGAWIVLTAVSYPYVLLPVRAALERLDPRLEEASRALGRGPGETFRHVVLPQLRPAIAAGGLLVSLYTLSDFGAVSLVRYDTFTRAIFLAYKGSFDRTPAAVLGLVVSALCVLVLVAEARSRGRAAYTTAGERSARPAALGRGGKALATTACAAVVGVALVLPVGLVTAWLVRGVSQGQSIDWGLEAAARSLEASFLGALATLVLAWPVAHLSARYPGRLGALVEKASYAGHALPGVVIALALVFFGARVVPGVYQTRAMLVFAYVVLFLPLAVGSLRTSLLQISANLEDASRSLGVGWLGTLRRVVIPMVRPGAAAALALVFLTAMKELPATLLLAPTGYSTLATEMWGSASEAFFARAAAPALLLVALSSVPLAVLQLSPRRRRG